MTTVQSCGDYSRKVSIFKMINDVTAVEIKLAQLLFMNGEWA